MTSISIVRIATPIDRDELWRLFLQAHSENGIFPLAADKVEYILMRCLYPDMIPLGDFGPRGTIGVIGPPGKLEGMVLLTINEYWYTRQKHLEEMLVYVDTKHRKSHHAKSLIKWLKEQAEVTGLPLLTGVISNKRTEAKCALYGRMLPKIGEFYLYKGRANGHDATATTH